MRRLILEEPLSAAAIWSRRLALFALVVAALALVLTRVGGLDPPTGLAVLIAAFLIAAAAMLMAAAAMVIIWRTGLRGVGVAIGGFSLAVALLAAPGWLAAQAITLPLLNDVSTDIADPPAFSMASAALAARGGRTSAGVSPQTREAQRRAYPQVQPIVLDLESDEAFELVVKTINTLGWRLIEQVRPSARPGGRSLLGHIEAIDKTLVMGFPDDVTVRLRPLAGQTRIDVRAASRYGRHDFGDNAARIRRFAVALQDQLDAK